MFSMTNPSVEKYLFQLAKKYDEPLLKKMESYGHKHRFPIIDRLVGAMVHVLALSMGAKTVFELGSGFGYSAYWFSKAVGSEGRVWCTDGDEQNRDLAKSFLNQGRLWNRIDFQVGEAVSLLKSTKDFFDIVYNDIDKYGYPAAWEVAKRKVRRGGLYICDNTLWSGRVAQKKIIRDVAPGWTEAIREHNQRIYKDKNFDVTLIPIRDGVIVARRK